MTVARTYFLDRTSAKQLAGLCSNRQDFHLENVETLNPTLARLQSLLSESGLGSEVIDARLNPPPGIDDLLNVTAPAFSLLSGLVRAAGWTTRPASDVQLRVTSAHSISVAFANAA
ncbi:hypothetical protein DBL07_03170 [Achromobacter mucicolens]|uniref:hypothetical protein n=1 Tax=Achromobacter mucicolens TaxID=1389922 RepID=UPI000D394971|nr:hypothetical protein [Achromobacter mucicolens]PTX09351.1 hypothetical protein DBL07_03170 [Achromobacter mucicolens]